MSDAKDLKIQALKEVISRDKVTYEEQIADLRVQLTQTSQNLDEARSEIAGLQERVDALAGELQDGPQAEVVEGEVVQETKPTRATKKSAK